MHCTTLLASAVFSVLATALPAPTEAPAPPIAPGDVFCGVTYEGPGSVGPELHPTDGKCVELAHKTPFQAIILYSNCTCKLYKKPGCTDQPNVVEVHNDQGMVGLLAHRGDDADWSYAICEKAGK